MRLNGKNFTIYSTDTITTIVSRIAANYDTLPEWLVFSPAIAEKKEDLRDMNVYDYLATIRGSTSLNLPQPPFPVNVDPDDILDVFIATNTALQAVPGNLYMLLASLNGKISKDAETIWRNRDSIIGRLSKNIKKNKTAAKALEQKAETIENIPLVTHTSVNHDKIQFTADFGSYNGSLLDLFNYSVPAKYIPYITCTIDSKSMFKVYREFKINPEWLTLRLSNVMLFKVNTEKVIRESIGINKYKHYTSAALVVTDDGRLLCTMDAAVGGDRYLTKSTFLERVMSVLPVMKMPVLQDNLILSHFVFPSQCFDPVIFADMLMMNETLNKFVVIDEFARASRTTTNSVYVKRIDGDGASSMILKQTVYAGEFGLKQVGEWYVLCRMRTRRDNDAKAMQLLLARIMTFYNNEYDRLIDIYRKEIGSLFVPNLCIGAATKRITKIKGLKGLRAIEPEIFYPTFTRKCTNPPIVVERASDTKNQVMLFPTKGEVGRDGSKIVPRLYTCATEAHKYIGLRENDLPNKDLFPYVPCCFARDQFTRAGSGYQVYFLDKYKQQKKQKIVEEQIDEYVIRMPNGSIEQKPNVNLEFNEIGEAIPGQLHGLPSIVDRFFQLIAMNPLKKFELCSIRETKYSAIEAILFARGLVKYRKMRTSTINNRVGGYVQTILQNLDAYAMAAKQELYDSSISEIKHLLSQQLSPSLFVHVIEILLDCNIFVFTNNGLLIPKHSRMYLKFKPSRETFLLFENQNGFTEIIGIRDAYGPPESFKMVFGPNDTVTNQIFSVFRQMTLSYSNMKEITIQKISRMDVTEQVVDSHGKCRVIIIGGSITIVPSLPIPPFAAKSALRLTRIKNIDMIKNINCDIIERRVTGSITREVVVRMGTMIMTILTDYKSTNNNTTNIPISNQHPIYDKLEAESVITAYKNIKTTASSVLQNTINEVLDSINGGLSLEASLRLFANNNGGLTDDNKRLLYACGQWIRTHPINGPVRLITAKELNTNISTAYVLRGEEAVNNLVKTYDFDYFHVFDTARNTTTPYFIQYRNEIYVALLATSITDANEIIDTWMRTGRVRQEDKMPTRLNAVVCDYDGIITDGDPANGCKILATSNTITAMLKS